MGKGRRIGAGEVYTFSGPREARNFRRRLVVRVWWWRGGLSISSAALLPSRRIHPRETKRPPHIRPFSFPRLTPPALSLPPPCPILNQFHPPALPTTSHQPLHSFRKERDHMLQLQHPSFSPRTKGLGKVARTKGSSMGGGVSASWA